MATPLQENQGAPPSRGAMQVRELQLQGSSRPKAKPRSANRNTPAEFAVCSSTASYVGAGIFRDSACDRGIRGRGFAWLTPGGASPLRRIRDLAGMSSPDLQTREGLRSSRYALPPRAIQARASSGILRAIKEFALADSRSCRKESAPICKQENACGVRGMLFHRGLYRRGPLQGFCVRSKNSR